MTARPSLSIFAIVPGGLKPTDHWHRMTNDNTCSRCRAPVSDDDVPLMLWSEDGNDMLIYCEACLGVTKPPPFEDDEAPT